VPAHPLCMCPLSQNENGDVVASFCLEDTESTRAMWNDNKSAASYPAAVAQPTGGVRGPMPLPEMSWNLTHSVTQRHTRTFVLV